MSIFEKIIHISKRGLGLALAAIVFAASLGVGQYIVNNQNAPAQLAAADDSKIILADNTISVSLSPTDSSGNSGNTVSNVARQINNVGGLVPCNGVDGSTLTQDQINSINAEINSLNTDITKRKADITRLQQKIITDTNTFNQNNTGSFIVYYDTEPTGDSIANLTNKLTIPASDISLDTPIDLTKNNSNITSGGTYVGSSGILLKDGSYLVPGSYIPATYRDYAIINNGVFATENSFGYYTAPQNQSVLQGSLQDEQKQITTDQNQITADQSQIAADQVKLSAQTGACNFNSLIQLIRNVMNAMFAISVFLATIAFVYIGFMLLTSQGNVSKIQTAKKMAMSVLIGFLFVLSAWLIVYTITHVLIANPVFNSYMS